MSYKFESISQLAKDFSDSLLIPYPLILGSLIGLLGSIFSFNGVRFQLVNESPAIINSFIFGLTGSGTGKNKAIKKIIEKCFEKIINNINSNLEFNYKFEKEKIESEAKKKYTKESKEGREFIDFKLVAQHIENYGPRHPSFIISDFTVEGIIEDRAQLDSFQTKGSTLFKNTEFLNWLKAKISEKNLTIGFLSEVFDHGDNDGKSTKGNKKKAKAVTGIPFNLIAYAPIEAMHEDDTHKMLMECIGTAFARRSFFYFEKNSIKELKTLEQKKQSRDEGNFQHDLNDFFFKLFEKTKQRVNKKIDSYENKVFKININSECDNLYLEYETKCDNKANEFRRIASKENSILANDYDGREWRMVKLATILQCVYNSDSEFIESKAMKEAIEITEYFGKYLFDFIYDAPKHTFQNCYEFFLQNIGKPITMMTLHDKRFFGQTNFKRHFDEFKDYAIQKAQDEGLVFELTNGSKNTKYACLKKLIDLKGE